LSGRGERVAVASFVAAALLGGGNTIGVRFSNRELAPLWGAGLRFALASTLLIATMTLLRLTLPKGRALTGAILYGAINFGAAFGLAYSAFVHIHAGLGQTLLAFVPLATLLSAIAQGEERFRVAAGVGALLTIVGISVIFREPLQDTVPLRSLLALIAAGLCFAQGAVLVRRFPPVHPVTMNAIGMATAAVVLVSSAILAREPLGLPHQSETWLALGYLVVGGSVLMFVLYVIVLQRWTASRAAYSFVLMPIVAIALSVPLDDEPIRAGLMLGGLLVLSGVYVGALRRPTIELASRSDSGDKRDSVDDQALASRKSLRGSSSH
jgi:drug/metabolite transporter (DMT)-like permease